MPVVRQARRTCSMSDCDLYCTRTYRESRSELTKFDSTKSMIRYRPPKGTAGFERSRVSGCRRSPRPPAMIIARTRGRRGMSRLPIGRWPGPGRVEVREAEVLTLEATHGFGGLYRQGRAVDQRAPDLRQAFELGVVLGHPSLGVVARRPRGDEELPVGRLKQQELTSRLADDAPDIWLGRVDVSEQVDPLGLRAVHAVPRPLGVRIEPDSMVASLAPRPFRERDARPRWHRGQRLAQRHRRDPGGRETARHVLQPRGSFEPPVPEQLGIVGRADDTARAGLARRVAHQLDEVARLHARHARAFGRVVWLLGPQIAGAVGDAPEPEPAG